MPDNLLRFIHVQCDELDPGPLPAPFQDSTMGPFTHWKLGWMRLTADDGRIGQAPGLINDPAVVRVLLSEGPRTPEEWWNRIWWMLRNAGHRNPATSSTLYALDVAFRDILAQRAGLPWHRYMGAARDVVPVYGSGGGTNLSEEALVTEMKALVGAGFKTLKMKVGKEFGTRMSEDIHRVLAVRAAIGPDIELAVDANQTWTAEQADTFANAIVDQRIAWFEEPVHSADRQAMRHLVKTCPFPIAMGESENHWLGYRDLYECGVQHLQPSPSVLPGYDKWREALDWSRKAGPLWSGGGFSHLTAMFVASQEDGLVEYLHGIIGPLCSCWSSKPIIAN